MAITRARKQELVSQYRELIQKSSGMVLSSYSGLGVREMEELRRKVREAGGEFHVVKNSLLGLAMQEEGVPIPDGSLEGTTAVGFAQDDIPAVAKAIVDLARDGDAMKLKNAVIEGVVYASEKVERLAELPPLSVVQAQLLGLFQAPGGRLAGALAGSVRQVVNVFKAYAESGSPEAPGDEE